MLNFRILKVISMMLLCLSSCFCQVPKSFAMFVDIQETYVIVENWLALNKGSLTREMGREIREVVHYHGEMGSVSNNLKSP